MLLGAGEYDGVVLGDLSRAYVEFYPAVIRTHAEPRGQNGGAVYFIAARIFGQYDIDGIFTYVIDVEKG